MTTGPSISVKADISGFQSALQKLEQEAKRVNSTLNSMQFGIDTDDAERQIKALQSAADDLTSTMQKAGEAGSLDPKAAEAMAAALEDAAKAADGLEAAINHSSGAGSGLAQNAKHARTLEDNIKRAARAQEVLAREGIRLNRQQVQDAQRQYEQLRRSGAAGAGRLSANFDDWVDDGWRNHSTSLSAAERRRTEVMRHLGIAGQNEGNHRYARLNALAGAMGGFGASLIGGGDGGMMRMAGTAAGSGIGMLAGLKFGGPVGMAAGMFASRLLGGAGGSIDAHQGDANSEAIMYSDLRKQLGETSVDFEMLRGSVRHLSDGLGVSYNDLAKMAKDYAHTAGLHGAEGMSIGGEVRSATGFARGYGIDPAQTAQFMANMRHFGVTSNERDAKHLALMIGESVQRGGTQGKMDGVLASLQSFVQSSTRASLSAANVGAYSSFMSSLTGLNLPGMKSDPANAVSAMAGADAAMRQGGASGDASRSFSLGLWQRKLEGFSAYDLGYMNDQGAFGTVGKAFGRDSAAYAMAKANGDHAKMAQYDKWVAGDSGKSVMAMQMSELDRQYGYSTNKLHNSIKGHFGVTDSQAAALYTAYRNDPGLGSLEKTLSASGIDIGKLNSKSIASLAELSSGGMSSIIKQSGRLRGMKLSKEDAAMLDGAKGDDALKASVLKLTAKYDNLDQGEVARKQQADMANSLQELATKLIPLTQWIKDGVIEIVRKLPFGGSDFVKNADRDKRTEEAKHSLQGNGTDKESVARKIIGDSQANPGKYNPDFIASLVGEYGRAPLADSASGMAGKTSMSSDKADFVAKTRAAAERAAAKINKETGSNISAEAIQAQWGLETGWGKSILGGTNNLGNIKAGSGWGGNSKTFRVKEYDSRGREFYTNQDFRAYSSLDEAGDDYASLIARRYLNKKPATNDAEFAAALKNGGYASDPTYDRKLLNSAASLRPGVDADKKIPTSIASSGAQTGRPSGVNFSGEFVLRDMQGRQLADPLLLTKNSCPVPAGWR